MGPKTEQVVLEVLSSKVDVNSGISFEFEALKHRNRNTPLFDHYTCIELEARYLCPVEKGKKEALAYIFISDLQLKHMANVETFADCVNRH